MLLTSKVLIKIHLILRIRGGFLVYSLFHTKNGMYLFSKDVSLVKYEHYYKLTFYRSYIKLFNGLGQ